LGPHPCHADPDPGPGFEIFVDLDPDPGFEIFADPDPGLDFSQNVLVFITCKSKQKTLDPDQNADPETRKC